jgi:hypothetical protein
MVGFGKRATLRVVVEASRVAQPVAGRDAHARDGDGLEVLDDLVAAERERLGVLEDLIHLRDARRPRRLHAQAGVGMTVLVTACAVASCVVGDTPPRLTVGVGIVLLALGIGLSLLAFRRRSETRWPLEPLITGLLCEACFGGFLIVEGIRNEVLVGDEVATLIGIATLGVPMITRAVVGRLQRP